MTLNCIHIFIVTGSCLYRCIMRPASQRFFIHSCIYLRILISYLATFLGTNNLSVLMCRKAVNQSISQVSWMCGVHLKSGTVNAELNSQLLGSQLECITDAVRRAWFGHVCGAIIGSQHEVEGVRDRGRDRKT